MKNKLMVTTLISIVSATMLLTACGKEAAHVNREAVKELESGMTLEEKKEFEEELYEFSKEFEELNSEQLASNEQDESEKDDMVDKTAHIQCLDRIRNAEFTDGIIQIADMVFSIDGTMTVGEFVDILNKSELDLEYDIPLDGMVVGQETYQVRINGASDSITVEACQITDGSSDTVRNAMVDSISYDGDAKWLPYGIGAREDMTVEDLISILEKNGYSSDGSTGKKYSDNGDVINIVYPCKETALDGIRKEIHARIEVDKATRKVTSVNTKTKDNQFSEARTNVYFSNCELISSANDFTPEIKEEILKDARQYLGIEIGKEYIGHGTFETIDFYKGFVLTKDPSSGVMQAGNTRIIYTGSTARGNIAYFGINYEALMINEEGELEIYGESEPDGISLDPNEAAYYTDNNTGYNYCVFDSDEPYDMIDF